MSNKKASNWFTARGLQLPKAVQTILDANNSIPNSTENVNQKDVFGFKINEDADIDEDYLKVIKKGDIETAQRMVDEVAKERGYTIKVYHGVDKLRQKETITFAAPVILIGARGNMAVVVNVRGNKYLVHRILLPDGSSFKFSEKK